MYLDDIGAAIKARVPADALPDERADVLFRQYAVLALAKGPDVGAEDVHNAWSAWMADIQPDHDSLVPFADLDEATKREDGPFVAAVRAVARELQQHGAN